MHSGHTEKNGHLSYHWLIIVSICDIESICHINLIFSANKKGEDINEQKIADVLCGNYLYNLTNKHLREWVQIEALERKEEKKLEDAKISHLDIQIRVT